MIDDAQDHPLFRRAVGDHTQVHCPDGISRWRFRDRVFVFAAQGSDRLAIGVHDPLDGALRDTFTKMCVHPIESTGDAGVTQSIPHSAQADYLLFYPQRLLLGSAPGSRQSGQLSIEVDLIRLWSAAAMLRTAKKAADKVTQRSPDRCQHLQEDQQSSSSDGHARSGS
ncbi:MAG: hypothetical protein IPK97_03065 [Ahniella sp.]|nr:hypothetical protein [Ahniella sp.]